MHVAICLFYNSPMGGLHLNVLDTCRQLRKAGHAVTVFCPGGPFGFLLDELGCTVLPLTGHAETAFDFDVIHVHPGFSRKLGEDLSRRLKLPLFATLHGKWHNQIARTHEAYTHIFGVSHAICDTLKRAMPAARRRISWMPNAVAPVEETDAQILDPSGALKILVASRLAADKQTVTEMLLDLWYLQHRRGIIGLDWHIAGDGEGLDRLAGFCSAFPEFAPRVTFHGWMDQDQLRRMMRASDVVLSPGRSAIEAMNMARPVIPLGSGGCQGLVTPDRFEICAYSNFGGAYGRVSKEAADVLEDLVNMSKPGQGPALGRRLQALVRQDFDLETHHKRLMKFYAKAVRDNCRSKA